MTNAGGERTPWLYRAVRDRRGQSTVLGMVLVLGIAAAGAGFVLVLGGQALNDTRQNARLSRADYAMTQFDSRAAMVGLGETSAQEVNLGPSGSGGYTADKDAGWIRVVHRNYNGSSDEVIYNASLGRVTYENGDTLVAYQGGGVWRHHDNGTSMVSPPEFHYRAATLTLPVIRIANDADAGGPTTALIDRAADSRRVYPNATTATGNGEGAPYDEGGADYANPVFNGTVVVTVNSEFYRGWYEYFRTRTQGNVSVDDANHTTSVELTTVGKVGTFDMADALSDDGLTVRGQSPGHSITDFNLTLAYGNGHMENLYTSFYAQKNGNRLEVVVHNDGAKCLQSGQQAATLDVTVFYRDLDTGVQQEWATSTPSDSGSIRLVCTGKKEGYFHIDFTGSTNLTYQDVSVSDQGTNYDDWDDVTPASSANFTHAADRPTPYSTGDTETLRVLTRHYFALFGSEFSLYATTGPGNSGSRIDMGASGGIFDYNSGTGGFYITYLHITENEVRVEFE